MSRSPIFTALWSTAGCWAEAGTPRASITAVNKGKRLMGASPRIGICRAERSGFHSRRNALAESGRLTQDDSGERPGRLPSGRILGARVPGAWWRAAPAATVKPELGPRTRREGRLKVVSLNVGLPREVEWEGHAVLTSIFKEPVERRLRVSSLNIEGDEQSDLTVHGGVEKAVYVYPSEHYEEWRRELPGVEFPWAVFGENLTTEGLGEDVRIGDRFRIGTAEFVVTQPRMPCYKLGIRFGRPDVLRRMLRTGRTGFYFSVAVEGEIGAGDAAELVRRAEDDLTVADVVRLYTVDARNQELLRRA